ncbi:MAG: hypothetical protein KBS81_02245, partial [Spirochaetales bacterium]|nr:hypothetical protein [Candidatus Physcosoma equi]
MNDIIVIVCCGVYVLLEAAVAFCCYRFFHWRSESVRKFIHIMTANLMYPITYISVTFWGRVFGPILFIALNAIASYPGLGKQLGMTDKKRHIGLVIYPFSVLVLTLLNIYGLMGAGSAMAGVFIMGWGDGFAALVGTKLGKHKYTVFGKYHKSVEGTVTKAVMSLIAVLLFAPTVPFWGALVVAILASVIENVSPSGIDNLSVPVLSAIFTEVLCT